MSRLYSPGTAAAVAELVRQSSFDRLAKAGGYGRVSERNVSAHRGGALVAPENTLSAYRAALEAGLRIVEADVLLRADGVPVLMHDNSALRTTGFNKNVSAITADEWEALRVNGPALMGSTTAYTLEPAPTFDQFLTLCKGRAVMHVEAKADAAVPVIIAYANAHSVDKSALVIFSFSLAALAPVPASGYQSLFLVGNLTGVDLAAVKAAGVTHIGYGTDDANTAGLIAQAASLGITCARWTINRRSAMATALANGAVTAISDDPEYLASATQIAYRDEFRARRWMPGMLASTSVRGQFNDDGSWGMPDTSPTSYRGMMMGWACPLPADNHQIVFDFRFDAAETDQRWCSVFVCADTDAVFADSMSDTVSGYHCLLRQGGNMQIYRRAAGSAATVINNFQCATPFPIGGAYTTIRVQVTPASITVTRVDTGEQVSVNNTEFRGGYFHLGRNGAAVRWRNVLVTRVGA